MLEAWHWKATEAMTPLESSGTTSAEMATDCGGSLGSTRSMIGDEAGARVRLILVDHERPQCGRIPEGQKNKMTLPSTFQLQ